MILHYIRISLRNLNKYKTQTAISICAMAVSLTLMAIVSSIMLSYKACPLLSQTYADRVEQYAQDEMSRTVNADDKALILGHQFNSVKEIHQSSTTHYNIMASANPTGKDEHSLIVYGVLKDPGYFRFLGETSVYSGERLGEFKNNEVVITDWLAKKLFGEENPIGKTISLQFPYLSNLIDLHEGDFTIRDVIRRPSPNNSFIFENNQIFVFTDNIPDDATFLYFVLRDGADREDLQKELADLLPERNFLLHNVKVTYDQSKAEAFRKLVILFLFIFVLVTFTNYIRQQAQLFRLREREVSLRTCIGSQPSSLFCLFATEIMIVLMMTLALSLTLIYVVTGFLNTRYNSLIESSNYSFGESYPIVIVSAAILIAIGIFAAIITVKRIRRDQTGLAMRMKPQPKHRFRNVGLIVQMTISILFLWLTSLELLSIGSIKEWYGIPKDADKYKRALQIRTNWIETEDTERIFARIDTLKSVERIFRYSEYLSVFDPYEGFPNLSFYRELFQNSDDLVDFYDLEIKEPAGKVNSDRYVLISEDFKKMLIDKNLWNGKTLTLPYRENGEYEIKGIFHKIPLAEENLRKTVIVTDRGANRDPSGQELRRIILPKAGKENETKNSIDEIIREELPTRVDIKTDSFFNLFAPRDYSMISAIISIIYILSIISVITTMAAVYSGVSLDTRRRRKEMALRKLSGAGPKVIAMIFLRTYIRIIAVAALIALPLGFIGIPKLVEFDILFRIFSDNIVIPYIFVLLLLIAVTALTIAWKIRDIMHADPIEYLKE